MNERRRKSNYIRQGGIKKIAAWPLLLIIFIKFAYLSHQTGMRGLSMYGSSLLLFCGLFAVLGYRIPTALGKMVAFHKNRESYRNAYRLYQRVMVLCSVFSGIIAICMFLFSDYISQMLFGSILVSLMLKIFAGCILLMIPLQCMRGYLEGSGIVMPSVVCAYLVEIISFVAMFLSRRAVSGYAQKVADLCRSDHYYFAYAATSGSIGLLVGILVGFSFMLVMFLVYHRSTRTLVRRDDTRSLIRTEDAIRSFLMVYIPEMIQYAFLPVFALALMVAFAKKAGVLSEDAGRIFASVVLMALPIILNAMQLGESLERQLRVIWKRRDKQHLKERLATLLKIFTYISFAYTSFVLAAANVIASAIFDGKADETLPHLIRLGALASLIAAFVIVLSFIIKVLFGGLSQNMAYVVVTALGIFMLQYFASVETPMAESFLYTTIVCGLIIVLFSLFFIYKTLNFKEDLVRIFPLMAISALVLGIVVLLVCNLFDEMLGGYVTLLVAAVLGYVSFCLCVVFTHTFDRYEWNELPFNRLPVFIARQMHIL